MCPSRLLLLWLCLAAGCGGAASSSAETSGADPTPAQAGEPSPAEPSAPASAADRAEAAELFQTAREAVRNGVPHEAAADLARAVALDPELAEAQLLFGKVLVYQSDVVIGTPTRDQGALSQAVEVLTRATELDPDSADAFYWLGQALSLSERREDAIAPLQRAVALEPEHALAHKRLGTVLAELGGDERALVHLERAVELVPEDASGWFLLAIRLEQVGELDAARAAYERSVALDWSVPGIYARFASVLRRAGDADGAKAAVRAFREWSDFGSELKEHLSAAKEDRINPEKLVRLAEVFVRGYRFEQARPWIERALQLTPDHARALELLALVEAGEVPASGSRFRSPAPSQEEDL